MTSQIRSCIEYLIQTSTVFITVKFNEKSGLVDDLYDYFDKLAAAHFYVPPCRSTSDNIECMLTRLKYF